jgi:hypothetical protein
MPYEENALYKLARTSAESFRMAAAVACVAGPVVAYAAAPADPSIAEAGRLIATILHDGAVTDKVTPQCANNGRLFGELVREADAPSSPISVFTVIGPRKDGSPGAVSNVTVKGDAHIFGTAIARVAQFFNDDGIDKAKELVTVCAKSHSAETIAPEVYVAAPSYPATDLKAEVCLWSWTRHKEYCEIVTLAPGIPPQEGFPNEAACQNGRDKRATEWLAEAKNSLGFTTGWAGDGYRIGQPHCVTIRLEKPEL